MFATVQSLSSPRRCEILRLVWREERAAGEIHRELGDVTFGAVSQHLRALETHGLVAVRSEGRRRIYRANREALASVAAMLEGATRSVTRPPCGVAFTALLNRLRRTC